MSAAEILEFSLRVLIPALVLFGLACLIVRVWNWATR